MGGIFALGNNFPSLPGTFKASLFFNVCKRFGVFESASLESSHSKGPACIGTSELSGAVFVRCEQLVLYLPSTRIVSSMTKVRSVLCWYRFIDVPWPSYYNVGWGMELRNHSVLPRASFSLPFVTILFRFVEMYHHSPSTIYE
jgi:hypothetical protein